jgi:hypothetical protein
MSAREDELRAALAQLRRVRDSQTRLDITCQRTVIGRVVNSTPPTLLYVFRGIDNEHQDGQADRAVIHGNGAWVRGIGANDRMLSIWVDCPHHHNGTYSHVVWVDRLRAEIPETGRPRTIGIGVLTEPMR